MAVIDLRNKNPLLEYQIARNLGTDINDMIQQYRNIKLQQNIISTLQRSRVNGLTPIQTRNELLKIHDIVNTQIGRELIEAQTGMGRYYQDPLLQQYRLNRIREDELLNLQREWKLYNELYENATSEERAKLALQKRDETERKIFSLTTPNAQTNLQYNKMPSETDLEQSLNIQEEEPSAERKGLSARLRKWLTARPGETAPTESIYRAKRGMPPVPVERQEKETAKFTPEGFVSPKLQPSPFKAITQAEKISEAPKGLEEIWNLLTDEEKQTAIIAMSQGKTAEQIVSYFKAQL